MALDDLRRDYTRAALNIDEVAGDPLQQFGRWFDDACRAGLREPNAMTLATVGLDGRPSARVLLMKDYDQRGLVFYTNYQSRKGQELMAQRFAALNFFWVDLERQVRFEGVVEAVSAEESDAYFASRPLSSRIGAWASPQSQVITGREELEARLVDLQERFSHGQVPRPPHWGGFRLQPDVVEFWQGRPSRLHDRLRYRRDADAWVIERLAP